MKKQILCWLLLLLLPAAAWAESLPLGGAAPYAPIAAAFSADGLSYDDGTLAIRAEQTVYAGTNITMVYVTCTDASQLRTALAAKYPSKITKPVDVMAQANNAVLAINGDFFSYHNKGVVIRNGQLLRNQPRSERDTLIIDAAGDFTIITNSSAKTVAPYVDMARDAFCFGPGLVVDGVPQYYARANEKVSCGANTKAQRLAICQMDTLSYLIVATEGPEQDAAAGLTIPEFTDLVASTGCRQAYNLDGGSSVTVIIGGKRLNAPASKNRAVSDIIYFATLASGE